MRKTYCDHCGKSVNFDELQKYRDEHNEYEVVIDTKCQRGYGYGRYDLCKDCQMAIDQLVINYLNNTAVNAT